MRSRHLVDPEVEPFLELIPQFDLSSETLAEIRRWMDDNPASAPADSDAAVAEEIIPGESGGPPVRVVIHRPTDRTGPLPVVVHCHAGGFVLGSPETHAAGNAYLAQHLECVVVSVDYRRPPEHPFPAPLEDCYTALRWVHRNADRLSIDPARIAVGGQSAGGGLAAALALLARDRGEVPLIFQLLIYPMLDDRTGSADAADSHRYAGEFCWTAANNAYGWRCMLGAEPGGADVSPYASPARAASLAGLPPTFIAVGALDLFVEEGIEYARRLIRDGVSTELHVYPGAIHAFDSWAGSENKEAFDRTYANALRRAFRSSPTRC